MVIFSNRTRPSRSASIPAIQPPAAEETRVTVASRPACAWVKFHKATRTGSMKAYSCTSMASRLNPANEVQNARRELVPNLQYQFVRIAETDHVPGPLYTGGWSEFLCLTGSNVL
ncbi:hypothetical protein AZA_84548 [Nitrospirillum viridazoti Y2]|nr:hypothetical protein AZA_84548 [Nitrospirillum amazonense Y2]